MKSLIRNMAALCVVVLTAAIMTGPRPAVAADAAAIERDSKTALAKLYETTPAAKKLGEKAKAQTPPGEHAFRYRGDPGGLGRCHAKRPGRRCAAYKAEAFARRAF